MLTAEQIINPPPPKQGAASTLWKLIREIPANIQALAAMGRVGFPTRDGDGTWFQRKLQQGTGIQVTNGDGAAGDPTVALNPASIDSLALANSALQDLFAGSNITVDKTDPKRPIVSADVSGSGFYPPITDQLGNPLTDQQGRQLYANVPSISYTLLVDVPANLSGIAALTTAGVPTRSASGVWSMSSLNVLPAVTLAEANANALTGVADFQMVAIKDLAGGREPCWYDSTVASGTKWRRFSDRSIAN